MKPEELEPFARFMKEHGLDLLYVEKPGFKLHLARGGAARPVPAGPAHVPGPAAAEGTEAGNRTVVASPLVGTFYRAPEPGAPPFVEAGSRVKAGDVLCIVEAMKVLNQVKSETGGVVVGIKAENGKPVEFGQALFVIEPD